MLSETLPYQRHTRRYAHLQCQTLHFCSQDNQNTLRESTSEPFADCHRFLSIVHPWFPLSTSCREFFSRSQASKPWVQFPSVFRKYCNQAQECAAWNLDSTCRERFQQKYCY